MKKLEKSIRHEINAYGAGIRAGHWMTGNSLGCIDGRDCLDLAVIEVENGLCVGCTLYAVGEAMERRHYLLWDGVVNVTEEIDAYINDEINWDTMIERIVRLAEDEMKRIGEN